MKFEQVYGRLLQYQSEHQTLLVLLNEETARTIYDHILVTGAKECLELGTGFGSTTCVMAAAVEELGGGTVTTVDHIGREPIGVTQLAELTGMSRYINAVQHSAGYNWFLMRLMQRQTRGSLCEPCFDFCFLDGAHEFVVDGLASLLVTRLLRPGSWLMIDDLNFRIRGSFPGWENGIGNRCGEELDARQVGLVFDLLVKTNPELGPFVLSNSGHIGWARKAGGPPLRSLPRGVIAGSLPASWSRIQNGAESTKDSSHNAGVSLEPRDNAVLIRSVIDDPFVTFGNPMQPLRPIDYVTLRVRLLSPDVATLQLFWVDADDPHFNEPHSMRCAIRASADAQDLTFGLGGSERARTVSQFRLDPADGPCEMLLESVSVGGWANVPPGRHAPL